MMKIFCSIFLTALCFLAAAPFAFAAEPDSPPVTCVEAEILEISVYPAPEKLDYPNCLVAVKVRVHQVLSGPSTSELCEVLFMLYRNKKPDRHVASLLKAHRKVKLKLIEFDRAPENIRETQQANDFLDLDGTQYYVVGAAAIEGFSPVLFPQTFKGRQVYRSLWAHSINPPRPSGVWARRQARMEKKKAEIAARLRSAANAVVPDRTVGEALAQEHIPYREIKLSSRDSAFVLCGRSLFSMPMDRRLRESDDIDDDDCRMLKKLNEFFLRQQIELMVVLIPDAHEAAERVVFPAMRNIPDRSYYQAAQKLLENGIEPVMLYAPLFERWKDFDLLFDYQNNDYHPHFGMAEIGGRVLADILHEHGIDDPVAKKDFTEVSATFAYPEYVQKAFGLRSFSMPTVFYRKNNISPDAPDSPVLVLGNSFARAPQYHASIPSRMALHSGVAPDLLKCEGYGVATIIPKRLLLNSERYLRGKKICFLVLHPSFIKRYRWADIQALDKVYSMISRRSKFSEISPGSLSMTGTFDCAPTDKSVQEQWKRQKSALPPGWLVFYSPKAAGRSYNQLVCKLPESARSDRPRLMCLEAFASYEMRVKVAQKSESLYANRDTLIFELPAGTTEFSLTVRGGQIYALGPIKIFDNQPAASE